MKRADVALVVGGAFPAVAFTLAVLRVLSFDAAISSISVAFSLALIPGIMENMVHKRGWSKQTTVMTASGLLSMGIMFLMLGLVFTGLTTFMSGVLWCILAAQAIAYAPKTLKAGALHEASATVLLMDELKRFSK